MTLIFYFAILFLLGDFLFCKKETKGIIIFSLSFDFIRNIENSIILLTEACLLRRSERFY